VVSSTGSSSSSSGLTHGQLAGAIVGPVLAALICLGLVVGLVLHRREDKNSKQLSEESRNGTNAVEMAETGNARDDSRANLDSSRHEQDDGALN